MSKNFLNVWISGIASVLLIIVFVFSCSTLGNKNKKSEIMDKTDYKKGTFGYDLKFLGKFMDPVILRDKSGKAMLIASSEWQGRVITSTAGGNDGTSYGWINYTLVESRKMQEHMNAFGGEDRVWLGPEGGQFSFYFKEGSSFDFENWFVPKEIDTEPFNLVKSGTDYAQFEKDMQLTNYSGSRFNLKLARNIRLLDRDQARKDLGISLEDQIDFVGFESESVITNTGNKSWTKETGMPSIWILGMFTPSPGVTIIIPYRKGDEAIYGPVVNDVYFGKIPPDRLKIEDGIILFRGDGKARGKIGFSPLRVIPLAGSYDSISKTLTIVRFSFREDARDFVNSLWEIQDEPFKGDVLNSYNDGPLSDGSQMGPFYEIESSSPAANLKPGESLIHTHQTYHFQGDESALNAITLKLFGIDLAKVISAF
jgi:hypothetical protein